MKPFLKSTLSLLATTNLFIGAPALLLAVDPQDEHPVAQQAASGSDNATVTGEVVDLVCYTDSGASGPGYAECANVCMNAGLPVGLKAQDGKTYVLVGDHKPLNTFSAGGAPGMGALRSDTLAINQAGEPAVCEGIADAVDRAQPVCSK